MQHFKKKDPEVLQADITQSQNPRQYFPVVFCLTFVNTLRDSANF